MARRALFYFLLLFTISAFAQVPATLSYQGILTDNGGNPVADGTYVVTFKFYASQASTTILETRGPLNVPTNKGLFTITLGDGSTNNTALPGSLYTNAGLWVGISVGVSGAELSRVQITTVPYAYRAQIANTLDATATVAGAQVSTGINATNITTGTLAATQIAASAIDNTKLASGIDASKITTGTLPAAVLPVGAGVPVGTIVAFGGTTIPTGWELCDGRSLSTTGAYAALFAAIGSNWGSTSAGTFRLPDLRGRFLRGRDGGALVDPDAADVNKRTALFSNGSTGDNVGSYQGDELKAHTHVLRGGAGGNGGDPRRYDGNDQTVTNSSPISSTGGSETRPKNAYVNHIIKAQ